MPALAAVEMFAHCRRVFVRRCIINIGAFGFGKQPRKICRRAKSAEGRPVRFPRPLLAALLAACGPGAERTEGPPDELDIDMSERGLIDCSERTDTGYVDGNPYAITVVTVDGKPVERDTANAYWVMQQAAELDGVQISVVSGFRT